MNYHCECCDYYTSKQSNFIKHELTAKHKKRIVSYKNEDKVAVKYHCECCDFYTSKKTDYTIHCTTAKHKKRSLVEKVTEKVAIVIQEHNDVGSRELKDYNLIIELVKENKDFKNLLVEQHKMVTELQTKIIELSKENKMITTTNNNTTNNNCNNTTNNQQFNLQFFLNDTCKDAPNFTDFIKSIQVTDDDLENNVKMGFVNGMTKIIMDNLRQLDLTNRPIHCTDVKRETIYVKAEEQWDKDNSTKVIQRGIQEITCKNMQQLCQWREENPEYKDYESNLSDFSDAMQQHSMAGTKREDFYPKIIKNIAKETKLEKNVLE